MAKITIEFDSIEEAQTAFEGHKWKLAMWDLDQLLRSTEKYDKSLVKPHGSEIATEIEYQVAERLRSEIREILSGYGLILD